MRAAVFRSHRSRRRGPAGRGGSDAGTGAGAGPGAGRRVRGEPHRLEDPAGRVPMPARTARTSRCRTRTVRASSTRSAPGVDGSRVGERVWLYLAAWQNRYGTAGEYTVVPQERAVALPDDVTFDLGANLGVPAMTAHRCLHADGGPDRNVLVARRRRRGRALRDRAGAGRRCHRDQHREQRREGGTGHARRAPTTSSTTATTTRPRRSGRSRPAGSTGSSR